MGDFEYKPISCDGLMECRAALLKAAHNKLDGNFIEGMACESGCIGGPACLTHGPKTKLMWMLMASSPWRRPCAARSACWISRPCNYSRYISPSEGIPCGRKELFSNDNRGLYRERLPSARLP